MQYNFPKLKRGTLVESSKLAGKEDSNYLSVIKITNPFLFMMYYRLGKGNFVKGIQKYEDSYYKSLYDISKIIYFLQDKRLFSHFFREKNISNLYATEISFINGLNYYAFKNRKHFSRTSFKKIRNVQRNFNSWFKENKYDINDLNLYH